MTEVMPPLIVRAAGVEVRAEQVRVESWPEVVLPLIVRAVGVKQQQGGK